MNDAEIIQLYKGGMSMQALGHEFDVLPGSIAHVLRKHDIPRRGCSEAATLRYRVNRGEILRLHGLGYNYSQISKTMGNVSAQTTRVVVMEKEDGSSDSDNLEEFFWL